MRAPAFASAILFPLIAALMSTAGLAQPALAQAANYTSVEATSVKPVQLSYHASAHKSNCTPAALPTIRVKEAPKWGMLTVKRALLTTDKIAGCPAMKVPRAGYTGPDHLNYEVTSENGEVATYDVTSTVKAPPVTTPPAAKGQSQ